MLNVYVTPPVPLGLICMVRGEGVSHWVLILRNLTAGIAPFPPLHSPTLSSIVPLIILPVQSPLLPKPPGNWVKWKSTSLRGA